MDLNSLREEIDTIDTQLLNLFTARMETVGKIADYKKQNNLPIFDQNRENEKLTQLAERIPKELRSYAQNFWLALFEESRQYQKDLTEQLV
ncbi:MAG: chorismate mutase [Evtepia sp.]